VNGGHQTVCDTELVVQNLSDRSQAVGGARCVRNELCALNVGLVVNAAYEHGGVVLRRSRHNYVLSASFDVSLSLFLCEEETGRFNNVFSTNFVPLQVSGVAFSGYADLFAVYDEEAVFNVSFDGAIELAVHCVILEHVSQVVNGAAGVDTNNYEFVTLSRSAENETTDTAETVNTYFSPSGLVVKKLSDKVFFFNLDIMIAEGVR
jgi:hypothetical protein